MKSCRRRACVRFCWALLCAVFGVLLAAASSWFLSLVFLYGACFLLWQGWCLRKKGLRFEAERNWWGKAKQGVQQNPLTPCCTLFGDTEFRHDESNCTRYRYPQSRPITREERLEIDRQWDEIISHMNDPEYGEEA